MKFKELSIMASRVEPKLMKAYLKENGWIAGHDPDGLSHVFKQAQDYVAAKEGEVVESTDTYHKKYPNIELEHLGFKTKSETIYIPKKKSKGMLGAIIKIAEAEDIDPVLLICDIDKLQIDEIKFSKNGIRFCWSSIHGFGQYDMTRDKDSDGMIGDSEFMDSDEDKTFIMKLMARYIDNMKIR